MRGGLAAGVVRARRSPGRLQHQLHDLAGVAALQRQVQGVVPQLATHLHLGRLWVVSENLLHHALSGVVHHGAVQRHDAVPVVLLGGLGSQPQDLQDKVVGQAGPQGQVEDVVTSLEEDPALPHDAVVCEAAAVHELLLAKRQPLQPGLRALRVLQTQEPCLRCLHPQPQVFDLPLGVAQQQCELFRGGGEHAALDYVDVLLGQVLGVLGLLLQHEAIILPPQEQHPCPVLRPVGVPELLADAACHGREGAGRDSGVVRGPAGDEGLDDAAREVLLDGELERQHPPAPVLHLGHQGAGAGFHERVDDGGLEVVGQRDVQRVAPVPLRRSGLRLAAFDDLQNDSLREAAVQSHVQRQSPVTGRDPHGGREDVDHLYGHAGEEGVERLVLQDHVQRQAAVNIFGMNSRLVGVQQLVKDFLFHVVIQCHVQRQPPSWVHLPCHFLILQQHGKLAKGDLHLDPHM
mmetsp:Transcript_31167/g.85744  ORF Transcript_31167/g.85744 Transcript_31167/m.85744 type:complete len:461 (+) Transcript_31167:1007-2389(+)